MSGSGDSNNNNNGVANKPEEPQPHPVFEQLPGVQYCINSPPPWLEAIFLGFQHYLLALGSVVLIPSMLVPQMGGRDIDKAKVIQTLLFVSGVNTLLHSFFGTRLPSIIGGSYAFLIPVTSIIHSKRNRMIHPPEQRFVETMREIQGALIVASCFQMIIGFFGLWKNIVRLFSPLSMVPLISFTGLGLYHLGFPLIAKCVEVGIPELVIMIIISQAQSPLCDRFALLFSVAIVWTYAEILTSSGTFKKSANGGCRTDSSGLIGGAPWVYIPFPFQWGPLSFRAGEIFATMVASFVASMESTGSFLAAARYGSATPVPPSVISRIGTFLNALFGSATGSTAIVVVQISSGFMIFFSIFGKCGAIFASIPLPIMAASYCIFFGYVSSAGLGFLQFCNLNSFRTKLLLGLSFIGLSLPQYFREHHLNQELFNDIMSVIVTSHATVAAVVAVLLDCTLPHGTDEAQKEEAPKDNGSHWWENFVDNKDVRNDEFYKLPGLLNRCFPSF
ncbi:hypothetical protein Pfo_016806 [Paulownia fortunei]|nr:hypothetical protein Pfo_016806 [Paulownia fortunei]